MRRCSGDLRWLKSVGTKVLIRLYSHSYPLTVFLIYFCFGYYSTPQANESGEVLVKASVLSELQRRVLKSEAALREKEEENDILQQRLQQYENRWSEYETKM